MRETIADILKKTSEIKDRKEKIEYLRKNDSRALRDILICVFNPNIKFLLPPTDPPYKAAEDYYGHEMIYSEIKKLYLFLEGGQPNLSQVRREVLFIQFLEAIHPHDAKLMLSIKNKKIPFPGITEKLVREAFPGLLKEKEEVK
jgi:hypothetical protein